MLAYVRTHEILPLKFEKVLVKLSHFLFFHIVAPYFSVFLLVVVVPINLLVVEIFLVFQFGCEPTNRHSHLGNDPCVPFSSTNPQIMYFLPASSTVYVLRFNKLLVDKGNKIHINEN